MRRRVAARVVYCASCGLILYRYIYNIIRVCVRASRRRRQAQAHPPVCARAGEPGGVTPPFRSQFFVGLTDVRHCGIMRGERGGGAWTCDGELWKFVERRKGLNNGDE